LASRSVLSVRRLWKRFHFRRKRRRLCSLGLPRLHYVTAILELAAGLLLIRAISRPYGAGLGALVMAAASLTTLLNADYDHAVAPGIVLFVSLAVLALSLAARRLSR
jgi:hypothetical protein